MSDTQIAETNFRLFIEQTVKNGQVWGLNSKDGWVISMSDEADDADEDAEDIDGGAMPFWSSKELAEKLARDEWKHYTPEAIPLGAFLEDWIGGMVDDGVLVGTNWDENLFGMEMDPLELAVELVTEVKKQGIELSFVHYEDIEDYEDNIRDVMKESPIHEQVGHA